jgi:hypothetical protein
MFRSYDHHQPEKYITTLGLLNWRCVDGLKPTSYDITRATGCKHARLRTLKRQCYFLAMKQTTNSVVLVRERTTSAEPTFCGWRVLRGQHKRSLQPYSPFSRPEPLLFLPSSSSIVLTRLSGPGSRSLHLRKSGTARNRTRELWICSRELWPPDHRGDHVAYSFIPPPQIWISPNNEFLYENFVFANVRGELAVLTITLCKIASVELTYKVYPTYVCNLVINCIKHRQWIQNTNILETNNVLQYLSFK